MWKPLDGLSYRIQFGPEFKYYRLGVFNAAEGINGDGNNAAKYNTNNTRAYTLDNLLYYNKTFAKPSQSWFNRNAVFLKVSF